MSTAKVQINKRLKYVPRDELMQWSKEELVEKVLKLEAYNFQLKQILQKKLGANDSQLRQLNTENGQLSATIMEADDTQPEQLQNHKKKKRKFDFSHAHKRHVLLKLLYFGWDYHGLACQEDSNATIEHHLFDALTRTCLIESRATANYHRCGRTDKEVSAYCQVISIDLRSKFPAEEQLQPQALAAEIDYCDLLNRVLPRNIQAIAWMPLRSAVYSARFDCVARTYRYYFPRGDLNVAAMQQACRLLEREADFRNFCKMDVNNGITNYVRQIYAARVQRCSRNGTPAASTADEVDDNEGKYISFETNLTCFKCSLLDFCLHTSPLTVLIAGYDMYFLEIRANSFLWHQIRCIVAVLLLIGQGREEATVISKLLDVDKNPCKPQYTPAIGLPLNLFHCEFREFTVQGERSAGATDTANDANAKMPTPADTTAWLYNEANLTKLLATVQSEWAQFSIKCSMIRDVLAQLHAVRQMQFGTPIAVRAQAHLLQDGVQPRQYQKLLDRKRCESLENRIEHFVQKKRLIVTDAAAETAPAFTAPATAASTLTHAEYSLLDAKNSQAH